MNKGKETDEKQLSAVTRVITIIEALSDKDSINLENLAKETDLPKATLLRFLSTLINLGYVYRDNFDHYSLTLKLFSLSSKALRNSDLVKSATPFVKNLSSTLGETVHMGIREGNQAVYVLKEESKYTIRMYSRIGKVIPLYCTAIGKIILSEMSNEELSEYLEETPLIPFTPYSIKTKETLLKELETIREKGYAQDRQEHEENITCIAAPIRDYTGSVIAALSVSWPLFRFEGKDINTLVKEIKNTCDGVSAILGYQPLN